MGKSNSEETRCDRRVPLAGEGTLATYSFKGFSPAL